MKQKRGQLPLEGGWGTWCFVTEQSVNSQSTNIAGRRAPKKCIHKSWSTNESRWHEGNLHQPNSRVGASIVPPLIYRERDGNVHLSDLGMSIMPQNTTEGLNRVGAVPRDTHCQELLHVNLWGRWYWSPGACPGYPSALHGKVTWAPIQPGLGKVLAVDNLCWVSGVSSR